MIQVKATCKLCEGTGYAMAFDNAHTSFCPNCKGMGIIILTGEYWGIELEQKPKEGFAINPGVEEVIGEIV